jgi:chromosome partitioning protein
MGKTIAVSNFKGGVGKSMTAASLGVGFARQGKRVLCLDADAQHSLTISFGIPEPGKLPITLATYMMNIINEADFDPQEGIVHHSDGVDLLPSNSTLAGLEVALAGLMVGRETILRQYIEKVKPLYDFVIVDCAPPQTAQQT